MIATKMIKKLSSIVKKHGDLDVMFHNGDDVMEASVKEEKWDGELCEFVPESVRKVIERNRGKAFKWIELSAYAKDA